MQNLFHCKQQNISPPAIRSVCNELLNMTHPTGNGFIDQEELTNVLASLGEELDEDQVSFQTILKLTKIIKEKWQTNHRAVIRSTALSLDQEELTCKLAASLDEELDEDQVILNLENCKWTTAQSAVDGRGVDSAFELVAPALGFLYFRCNCSLCHMYSPFIVLWAAC